MPDLRYKVDIETDQARGGIIKLGAAVKGFVAALAVREIIQFGDAIIDASKRFQTYQNQLRLITTGQKDLADTFSLLEQTARANRTSLESTIDLYTKLRVSTLELGISSERIVEVTTKLSQALAVAGADVATTNSVIRQFGQAMASGSVRGDEFNSIVEGLGPALNIMASETGITVGQLRKMSQEGKLTAEVLFEMLESSKALTIAFNTQKTTTAQLETALSDAFDKALVKTAEVLGITEAYEQAIKRTTRQLDRFNGSANDLSKLSLGDIYKKAVDGTLKYDDALFELSERLKDNERFFGLFSSLSSKEVAAINGIATQIKLLQIESEAAAKKAEEHAIAEQKRKDALNQVLAPHRKFINQAKEFAATDYNTELEKAVIRVETAKKVLENLQEAQRKTNGQVDNFANLLKGTQNELKAAEDALLKLQEAEKGLTFGTFYKDFVKKSQEAINEINFLRQAQEKLKEDLNSGAISSQVYAEALDRIKQKLDQLTEATRQATETSDDFLRSLDQKTADLQFELASLNMTPLQKQIKEIERDINQGLNERVRELRKLATDNPEQASAINKEIARIQKAASDAIVKQTELVKESYKQQRSWSTGWRKAFEEYQDNATNAAKAAERVFQKTTQGMEDAIVNFAKTGKFEFKSLLNTIVEELLRTQIRQLLANVFSGGSRSGGGGLFSGLGRLLGFANGGIIPTNAPVVVGERGPEVLTNARGKRVIPNDQLGGSTQVVYNINAVDARSFKEMIARDPAFLFAVTEQGRRRLPGVA